MTDTQDDAYRQTLKMFYMGHDFGWEDCVYHVWREMSNTVHRRHNDLYSVDLYRSMLRDYHNEPLTEKQNGD